MSAKRTMMLPMAICTLLGLMQGCHKRELTASQEARATEPLGGGRPATTQTSRPENATQVSSPQQSLTRPPETPPAVQSEHADHQTDQSDAADSDGQGAKAAAKQQAQEDPLYPPGIDPKGSSTDPTYAYTKQNPVKVGLPGGLSEGPVAERVYLRHLRDTSFQPMTYTRMGSVSAGTDGHSLDVYEVYAGNRDDVYHIYLDMYHPECDPLEQKAPMGLYFSK